MTASGGARAQEEFVPRWRAIVVGALTGLVIAVELGLTTMLAQALHVGVQVGIDGTLQAVAAPVSAAIVGVCTAVFAALVFFARDIWWVPLAGRISAVIAVASSVVAGNLMFDPRLFPTEILTESWLVSVPVYASQTMATYALLGLGIASIVSSLLATRRVRRDIPVS